MNRTLAVGLALTAAGLAGYGIGVAGDLGLVAVVPGRAFSVTGVMAGITLIAVGSGSAGEDG